ncbi:tetratricopeptide repeat protein [Shewanella sp. 10N.286.51.B8]|uniref:tetratricopeptide repeat protein n=1 Tax=Shewanella sp. 10N.286.51.B8 TaxID=3229708 RepID=UPI00354F2016
MFIKQEIYRFSIVVISLLSLSACSSMSQKNLSVDVKMPAASSLLQLQASKYTVPSIESLTQLTPIQERELLAFIADEEIAALPNRKKVSQFIGQKMVNFNYEGSNFNASDAWLNKSGNCMSLAMLTYGVAKFLNVKAVFQVVHSAPLVTVITKDLMVSSDHVRTFLYEVDSSDSKSNLYLYGGEFSVIDYFPDRNDRNGGVVSDSQFLAMFYRNLAADALLDDKLELAFALMQKGLSLAPDYVPLINMMAVVHRRIEAYDIAEAYYQYGLQFKPNSLSLLSNYSFVLNSQGRIDEAQSISQQLLDLENESPYGWYSMGIEALALKDYRAAEIFFRKFIKNSPYFHQAYYELAKALNAQGKPYAAKQSLKEALTLTSLGENQQKYLAKLNWLNSVARKGLAEQ